MTSPRERPSASRRLAVTAAKVVVTAAAFALLLSHHVQGENGERVTALRAIIDYLPRIEARTFWEFVALGAFVKALGILASIVRWHILLIGQGMRFSFRHIAGTFLVGRFLGTFLPSTIGLDGYKLYDAARFTGRAAQATAATMVEKVLGIVGLLATFLFTLPLGYRVLGERAVEVAALTVPIALALVTALLLLVLWPGLGPMLVRVLPGALRLRVEGFAGRVSRAAASYRERRLLLVVAVVLSFLVHFCTAALYYFTALAAGAAGASFWQVSFASSIQILATVLSPFTIAGEGVREIVQTLLLARHIGTSQSIISAALGFWAAEALTLCGGIIYLLRPAGYRPQVVVEDAPAMGGAASPRGPEAARDAEAPVARRR